MFSFGIKEQLLLVHNVNEVNRERSRLTAASSVYDSTKHNGPITCDLKMTNFNLIYNKVNVKTGNDVIHFWAPF